MALVGPTEHNVRARFQLDPRADPVLADKIHVQHLACAYWGRHNVALPGEILFEALYR